MARRKGRLTQLDKKALKGKRLIRYMSAAPVRKMSDIAMLSSYNAGLKESLVRDTDETMKAIKFSDKIVDKWRSGFKKKFGVNIKLFPWGKKTTVKLS